MKGLLILGMSLCFLSTANANCMINITSPTFGVYQSFAANDALSSGTISRDGAGCESSSYTLQLSKGSGTTYAERRLRTANDSLKYNIYLDSGRTAIFGDGTEGTVTVNTSSNSVPVYVSIPAYQRVTPGEYFDNLSVSIVY